jgi:hypothetical protein
MRVATKHMRSGVWWPTRQLLWCRNRRRHLGGPSLSQGSCLYRQPMGALGSMQGPIVAPSAHWPLARSDSPALTRTLDWLIST